MDIATIIGLITGTVLLLWAIMGKSDIGAFIDGGSVAIVLGGSVSALLISFPIQNIFGVAKVVKNCFFGKAPTRTASSWTWSSMPKWRVATGFSPSRM